MDEVLSLALRDAPAGLPEEVRHASPVFVQAEQGQPT